MRPNWDAYFLDLARSVSARGTCSRKRVGAVLVRDKQILSTGYNGALPGLPHCDEVGHLMEHDHCVRVVHAEVNAVAQAAKNGVKIDGASLYVTASPCWQCFRTAVSAGVKAFYFGEFYRDERIFAVAEQLKIPIIDLSPPARMAADDGLGSDPH